MERSSAAGVPPSSPPAVGLIVRLRDQLTERTADRDRLQKELDAMKAELEALKK